MNDNTAEFEKLRNLLALKRFEQPPPAYFRNFSNSVIARINAAEGDSESVWLLGFWHSLVNRPILAGAFGALAFGLVVFGLAYNPDASNSSAGLGSTQINGLSALSGSSPNYGSSPFINEFVTVPPEAVNSTNPVTGADEPPSLFSPVSLTVERTGYRPGSN